MNGLLGLAMLCGAGVLIAWAVAAEVRSERELREALAEADRAWDSYIAARQRQLEEMIAAASRPAPRKRITWVPEMDEEIRNA